MLKEYKSDLNKMLSLMERMDKHMLGHEVSMLNEDANNASSGSKKFKPICTVKCAIDVEAKKRQIELRIGALAEQTTSLIKCTAPYKNDRMGCRVSGDKHFITITKEIPWQVRKKRQQPDSATTQTQQATTQPQQAAGGFNFMNALNAAKGNVNEGFNFMNALNAANAGNNNAQPQPSQPQQTVGGFNFANALNGNNAGTQTPSTKVPTNISDITVNGFASPDDENAILKDWLNNYYKGIVDIIAKHSNLYDPQYLQNLYDIQSIMINISASKKDPEQTKIYNAQKNHNEIIDEIAEALKNGNYAQVISNLSAPLNLEGAVWGNVLSPKNIRLITNQATQHYGLTPSDPDYPTMVMGALPWKQNYNRSVNPNARPYNFTANKNGSTQKGAQGGYETVNMYGAGFNPMPAVAYDISDTTPIDPNEDWFQTKLGIKNNLTGELNQIVLDALQAVKDKIPEDLAKEAANINSDKGKAKIYNEALKAYASENGLTVNFRDVTDGMDDSSAVSTYGDNVIAIADTIADMYGFAKGAATYGKIKDCLCFAIAHYTVGENLFGRFASQHGNNLSVDWKTYATQIVGSISHIYDFIQQHVFDVFSPLRDEVTKLFSEVMAQSKDDTNAEPDAQTQINESFDLDALLNELNYE